MTLNILALDIATKTGWASRINGVIQSGVMDMNRLEEMGAKGWAFSKWICDKLDGIDMLVIERPFGGRNGNVAYYLGGLAFTAHAIAAGHGVKRTEVPPKTIKKFVTDNGAASKADIIDVVRRWGFNPADDNEADSLALLTYAIENLEDR